MQDGSKCRTQRQADVVTRFIKWMTYRQVDRQAEQTGSDTREHKAENAAHGKTVRRTNIQDKKQTNSQRTKGRGQIYMERD